MNIYKHVGLWLSMVRMRSKQSWQDSIDIKTTVERLVSFVDVHKSIDGVALSIEHEMPQELHTGCRSVCVLKDAATAVVVPHQIQRRIYVFFYLRKDSLHMYISLISSYIIDAQLQSPFLLDTQVTAEILC